MAKRETPGGYRKPTHPASVSGPGSKSRRTDGGPGQPIMVAPGGAYGDRKELTDLQQAAPLADSAANGGMPGGADTPAPQIPPVTPFSAPTERPDEPVTAGNPMGPGPGPSQTSGSSIPDPNAQNTKNLMSLLPIITQAANGPNGTPELRNMVLYLRSQAQ